MMGGGPAATEFIGLMAPTGGGKSTLISQMACERAKLYRAMALGGGPSLSVLYFTYEDPFYGEDAKELDRIWIRMMAHYADVDRNQLERVGWVAGLSTTGNLKPYELALCGDQDPATFPGERERIERAMRQLEPHQRIFDMQSDGRGNGGVPEIVQLIEREIDNGHRPGVVLIDSINLLLGRNLSAQGRDLQRETPTAMALAVEDIRREVGVRFGADVWVTNQVAGAMTKRSPGAGLHHSDAAGAKLWAQATDFCWAIGALDNTNDKAARFDLSKARRGGCDGQHIVARLNGKFARWEDCSDKLTIYNGAITPIENLGMIGGMPPPKARKPRRTDIDDLDLDLDAP
jgi:hypothetical protein